jgi:hypothetical protein
MNELDNDYNAENERDRADMRKQLALQTKAARQHDSAVEYATWHSWETKR